MYEPLKFVEMIKNYFKNTDGIVENKTNDLINVMYSEILKDVKYEKIIDSYFGIFRLCYNEDYINNIKANAFDIIKDFIGYNIDIDDAEQIFFSMYCKICKIVMPFLNFNQDNWFASANEFLPIEDFKDLSFYHSILNKWEKNKIVYKIDDELCYQLSQMKVPEFADTEMLMKIPNKCFYIDCSEFKKTDYFCNQKYKGTLVKMQCNEKNVMFNFVHLVEINSYLHSVLSCLIISSENGLCDFSKIDNVYKEIKLERGNSVNFSDANFIKFFINLICYLNIANNDIEISEITKKRIKNKEDIFKEQSKDTIKNKFSEVKQLEVGFRYGETIRRNRKITRYKYEGDKFEGEKRDISSHFRSAHWHSYWVGKGKDKKLILKWVDEVFVKGSKEQNKDVIIHKIE